MSAIPIARQPSAIAAPAIAAWQTLLPSRRTRLRLRDKLLAWPVPLAVLLLWWVAARFEWIAPQVLPSPEAVALTVKESLVSGELWGHLKISLMRVVAGFGAGLVGGLLLGVAMGLSPTFKSYVYPLFKAFSQVPVLGWLPLLDAAGGHRRGAEGHPDRQGRAGADRAQHLQGHPGRADTLHRGRAGAEASRAGRC